MDYDGTKKTKAQDNNTEFPLTSAGFTSVLCVTANVFSVYRRSGDEENHDKDFFEILGCIISITHDIITSQTAGVFC